MGYLIMRMYRLLAALLFTVAVVFLWCIMLAILLFYITVGAYFCWCITVVI
jgi:hypothetical protein